jgi:hypothetical protein
VPAGIPAITIFAYSRLVIPARSRYFLNERSRLMPETKSARARENASETLPLEEQVRRRAYELYVERGNQSGSEFDDWLQAESEIREASEHGESAGIGSSRRRT